MWSSADAVTRTSPSPTSSRTVAPGVTVPLQSNVAASTGSWAPPAEAASTIATAMTAIRCIIFLLRGDRDAIDRRRTRNPMHGMLVQEPQRFSHRPLQLGIVTLDHLGRSILDLDIRRDTFVLDPPFSVGIVERQVRRGDAAIIGHRRHEERPHQSTPRPRTH